MTKTGLALALAAVVRALKPLGVPYAVIGGVAVIVRGVPRHTDDLDLTIWAPDLRIEDLLQRFAAAGITPRVADALDFAIAHQILLLKHASGTELDVSLAWLPFELEAMQRASVEALRGVPMPVAQAEDLVIYKVLAGRERDWADTRRLLEQHRASMNIDRIVEVVQQLTLAMEQPERLDQLQSLLREV